MASRVSRAEKILSALTEKGALSPSGKDWLIAALDPMHDNQLQRLDGWPDVETAPSVVRCIKQSITIATPYTTTSNWDCHIVAWPWANTTGFCVTSAARQNDTIQVSTATLPVNSWGVGGVQAYATLPNNPARIGGLVVGSIDLDPSYLAGPCRLIGQGWEIVNTTSDLNRQGQVTVYRQPECRMEPQVFKFGDGTSVGMRVSDTGATGQIYRPMPATSASAMLLPGTRQWKAAEGCYVAVPFVGQDNPPLSATYIQPLISFEENAEDTVTFSGGVFVNNNIGVLSVPTFTDYTLGSGVIVNSAVGQHLFPQHQTGAIFTGLSAASTLTLTVNYYIESFPGPAEPGILVLATPSAQYDPCALEIFSHCLGTLPVGVPAGDNITGGWFADAVAAASKYIGPIASAMGYNGIAKGLKVASSMASGTYMAPPSPQGIPRLGPPKKDRKAKPPPVPARNTQTMQQLSELAMLRAENRRLRGQNGGGARSGRGGKGKRK